MSLENLEFLNPAFQVSVEILLELWSEPVQEKLAKEYNYFFW